MVIVVSHHNITGNPVSQTEAASLTTKEPTTTVQSTEARARCLQVCQNLDKWTWKQKCSWRSGDCKACPQCSEWARERMYMCMCELLHRTIVFSNAVLRIICAIDLLCRWMLVISPFGAFIWCVGHAIITNLMSTIITNYPGVGRCLEVCHTSEEWTWEQKCAWRSRDCKACPQCSEWAHTRMSLCIRELQRNVN